MVSLAEPLRGVLLDLPHERAATVTELAQAVGRPKSTVAYHVNVLVDAGGGLLLPVPGRRLVFPIIAASRGVVPPAPRGGYVREQFTSLLTPVDAAAMTGELAEYLVASAQDGLAPGSQGWYDDGVVPLVLQG